MGDAGLSKLASWFSTFGVFHPGSSTSIAFLASCWAASASCSMVCVEFPLSCCVYNANSIASSSRFSLSFMLFSPNPSAATILTLDQILTFVSTSNTAAGRTVIDGLRPPPLRFLVSSHPAILVDNDHCRCNGGNGPETDVPQSEVVHA